MWTLLLTPLFTCQGLLACGVVGHDELARVPLLSLGLQTGELGLDSLVDLRPLLFAVVHDLPMAGETETFHSLPPEKLYSLIKAMQLYLYLTFHTQCRLKVN